MGISRRAFSYSSAIFGGSRKPSSHQQQPFIHTLSTVCESQEVSSTTAPPPSLFGKTGTEELSTAHLVADKFLSSVPSSATLSQKSIVGATEEKPRRARPSITVRSKKQHSSRSQRAASLVKVTATSDADQQQNQNNSSSSGNSKKKSSSTTTTVIEERRVIPTSPPTTKVTRAAYQTTEVVTESRYKSRLTRSVQRQKRDLLAADPPVQLKPYYSEEDSTTTFAAALEAGKSTTEARALELQAHAKRQALSESEFLKQKLLKKGKRNSSAQTAASEPEAASVVKAASSSATAARRKQRSPVTAALKALSNSAVKRTSAVEEAATAVTPPSSVAPLSAEPPKRTVRQERKTVRLDYTEACDVCGAEIQCSATVVSDTCTTITEEEGEAEAETVSSAATLVGKRKRSPKPTLVVKAVQNSEESTTLSSSSDSNEASANVSSTTSSRAPLPPFVAEAEHEIPSDLSAEEIADRILKKQISVRGTASRSPSTESTLNSNSNSSDDNSAATAEMSATPDAQQLAESKAAADALLMTIARNALGGREEVLVDPSRYLMHVCYDDVQGIAPRGVIVFSNGDDEFFSHETAVAPSQRSRGLYRNAVIGAEHVKLMETIGAKLPELGAKSPTTATSPPSLGSPTAEAARLHTSGFIGGGVSTVMHSKADDPLYGNMGVKWQCVEFARRWLLMTRGVWMRSIPTAEQIWSLSEVVHVASGKKVKLTRHENGRSKVPPRAGDLIIYRRAHDIPFGHVAAIVEVGKDYVRIAEQNQEFVSYKSLEKLDAAQKAAKAQRAANGGSSNTHASASSIVSASVAALHGKHAAQHHEQHAHHQHVAKNQDHGRLRPGLLPDDSELSHRKGSAVPLVHVADESFGVTSNSAAAGADVVSSSANYLLAAEAAGAASTTIDGAPITANSAIHSSRHYGRQMPLRLDFSTCGAGAGGDDALPMVEIVDEDPVLGWVRAECPLVDFAEDDVADTFRHILTLGTVSRVPLPPSPSLPDQPNPLVSLPWLDTTRPTDFFLKRSLVPADAPSVKDAVASPSDVPDAYYRMSYDFYMRIRNAAQSLHRLAIDATWKVVHCAEAPAILRHFFNIPDDLHDHLRRSLFREPPLGGRFDFGFDGERIVMMEYNCDSSAALLECCETQEKMLDHYGLLDDEAVAAEGDVTAAVAARPSLLASVVPSGAPAPAAEPSPSAAAAAAARSRASSHGTPSLRPSSVGVEPSRLPPARNSTGSFLTSKYRAYFRAMRHSAHAEALCPSNNTIHFMVDDDDEERYTALVAMGCAEAEGFAVKMCVKLTDFSFYPPAAAASAAGTKKESAKVPPAAASVKKGTTAATSSSAVPPALQQQQASEVAADDANERTGHGPCSRRVFDREGVEVQLVWKTWSWDTVLRDHRKHIADKALAAANNAASASASASTSLAAADGAAAAPYPSTAAPRLCQILINNGIRVVEPFWKTVTGSKAILPIMYSLNPTHDSMVCSYFDANEMVRCGPYLSKPVSGRAGQNITFFDADPALNNSKTRERMRRRRVELAKHQSEDPSTLFEAAGLSAVSAATAGGSTASSFTDGAASAVKTAAAAAASSASLGGFVSPLSASDGAYNGDAAATTYGRSCTEDSQTFHNGGGDGEGGAAVDAEDAGLEASEGRFHDSLMIFQRRIMLKGFSSTEELLRRQTEQSQPRTLLAAEASAAVAADAAGTTPSASSNDSAPALPTPQPQPSPHRAHRVYPIFCAWMIDDHFGGIVVREDDSKITKLSSKVMPCLVVRA